jgi:multicomponent Na+:H+ antiporter subunit D
MPGVTDTSVVRTAIALFAVGLSIKMALFPLHLWLPSAYACAPSAVTALVAGTATKVSAYVMARMLFTVFTPTTLVRTVPITEVMTFFASVAIIAGPLLALAQKDVKRILAYSSVGQIGYIVLGVTLVDSQALTGAIFHIANHAALKACLFCGAGAVVYRIGICDIDHFNGLAKRMPITAITMTIAGLSLIGVPLTGGFLAKWYLASGAIRVQAWFVLPCILISSLISTVYIWRIVHRMYFGDPAHPAHAEGHGNHEEDPEQESAADASGLQSPVLSDPPLRMRIAMIVLAACCIAFGTVGAKAIGAIARTTQGFVPETTEARR